MDDAVRTAAHDRTPGRRDRASWAIRKCTLIAKTSLRATCRCERRTVRGDPLRPKIEKDYRRRVPTPRSGHMALDLDGLIPATVLPMQGDGSIDEPALRSYIGWVVEQGPVALAINVDTGEGPHLTHDEKVRIIKVVREVTDL